MLAYFLAIALALASLILFFTAFFAPDIHRQDDFLWSGVGLFYALVLWICAGRITGGVLLGQGAAVALVLYYCWQTIRLRRAIAYPQEKVEDFSLLSWVQNRFSSPQPKPTVAVSPPTVKEVSEPKPMETPEIGQNPPENKLEENEELDFEPFVPDHDAETVIEAYQFQEVVPPSENKEAWDELEDIMEETEEKNDPS